MIVKLGQTPLKAIWIFPFNVKSINLTILGIRKRFQVDECAISSHIIRFYLFNYYNRNDQKRNKQIASKIIFA